MLDNTPRSLRINIAIIGCCNVGKSSLFNALTKQNVAIVSSKSGTTTDAVAKPYELLPLGPVTFFDTAGLDDSEEIGNLRINATYKILFKTDVAVLVVGKNGITQKDKDVVDYLNKTNTPFVIAFNQTDLIKPNIGDIDFCRSHNIPFVEVSAINDVNINLLKEIIINSVPEELKKDPLIVADLLKKNDTVILVVPIDLSAPKGRLILPQVQVLRELLDANVNAVVVKENNLLSMLDNLKQHPALVITDSQVVNQVANILPPTIKMTTFSTLFARYKADINVLIKGAEKIDNLCSGDKILIAEACSHHALADDIAKVKIPRWLQNYCHCDLVFDFCSGSDFPQNLEDYNLVIHCGACMLNSVEMTHRLKECVCRGIPITNYGLVISKTQNLLQRICEPFI